MVINFLIRMAGLNRGNRILFVFHLYCCCCCSKHKSSTTFIANVANLDRFVTLTFHSIHLSFSCTLSRYINISDWITSKHELITMHNQCNRGTHRQFSENICSEDDLRSRIFGTFFVKFLACLPLLGFSRHLQNGIITHF